MATAFKTLVDYPNGASTLASNITNSAASITLASDPGTAFPTANFWIRIGYEQILCASRAGAVLTCTGGRGVNGTSAASHTSGDTVTVDFFKAHIEAIQTAVKALETTGAVTALAVANNATIGGTLGITGITTHAAGSVSAPSVHFGDSGSGLYRSAANELAATISGTQRLKVSAAGASVTGTLAVTGAATISTTLGVTGAATVGGTLGVTGITTLAAGTVGAPSVTLGDSATGLYRSAANEVSVSISGSQRLKLSSTGGAITGALTVSTTLGVTGVTTLSAGSVSAPALTLGDSGSGLYRSAADEVATTIAGTQRLKISASGASVTGILSVSGSITTQQQTLLVPNSGISISPQVLLDSTTLSNTYAPNVTFRRARDTAGNGVPAATVDGDIFGQIGVAGYSGSGYDSTSIISFQQDGTVSGTNVPGRIVFQTAPNNGGLATVCTMFSNKSTRFEGNMGFNAVAPIAKPTVTGSRGSNAALASLLTALANYGLITDSSS